MSKSKSKSSKSTSKSKSANGSSKRMRVTKDSPIMKARIVVLTKGKNPRRPGTRGYESFKLYMQKGVRTVADYLGYEGAGMDHLGWDKAHNFIKLESGKAA